MARLLVAAVAFAALAVTSDAVSINNFKSSPATRDSSATSSNNPAGGYDVNIKFESASCSGVPMIVSATRECNASIYDACIGSGYFATNGNIDDEVPYSYNQVECATDPKALADEKFGDQVYLQFDYYNDEECAEYESTSFVVADGKCHVYISLAYNGSTYVSVGNSFRLTVNSNMTITYAFYDGGIDCSGNPATHFLVTKEQLLTGSCASSAIASTNMNLSNDVSDTSGSQLIGTNVKIIASVLLLVGIVM